MVIPIIAQAPINPAGAFVDANRDEPDSSFELRYCSYIFSSYMTHLYFKSIYVSTIMFGACAYFATRIVTYIGRDLSIIQALEQSTLFLTTELPFLSIALFIAMFATFYFTSMPYVTCACGIIAGLSTG